MAEEPKFLIKPNTQNIYSVHLCNVFYKKRCHVIYYLAGLVGVKTEVATVSPSISVHEFHVSGSDTGCGTAAR